MSETAKRAADAAPSDLPMIQLSPKDAQRLDDMQKSLDIMIELMRRLMAQGMIG